MDNIRYSVRCYILQDQLLQVQEEQKRLQTEQQHSSRDSRICLIQWYTVFNTLCTAKDATTSQLAGVTVTSKLVCVNMWILLRCYLCMCHNKLLSFSWFLASRYCSGCGWCLMWCRNHICIQICLDISWIMILSSVICCAFTFHLVSSQSWLLTSLWY